MADIRRLKRSIDAAIDELIRAMRAAEQAGDPATVDQARTEARALQVISDTLLQAINQDVAVRLDAVADRLEQSIRAQTAVSLRAAARMLAAAVREAVGRVIVVAGDDGASGGASGATGSSGTGESGSGPASGSGPSGAATGTGSAGGTTGSGAASGDGESTAGRLVAKAGPHKAVIDAIILGMGQHGLDPLPVLAIVSVETGGTFDHRLRNRQTSAGGLFQFVDGTWLSVGGTRHGTGGKGNGHAAHAPLEEQVRLGCKFAADNVRALERLLGRLPTVGQHYLSHMFGMGGCRKLFAADPATTIETLFGAAIAANNGLSGKTAGDVIRDISAKLANRLEQVRGLLEGRGDVGPAVGSATGGGASGGGASGSGASGSGERPIAQAAVAAAVSERDTFARPNGAIILETVEPLRSRVLKYFRDVGRGDITDPAAEAWSAAFISHCLRAAGATAAQFRFSAGHRFYIFDALRNALAGRHDSFLVYADRTEAAPRIGDLVGRSRDAGVKTTADIAARMPANPADDGNTPFPCHTDLVLSIAPGEMIVIGGNKNHSIRTERVPLEPDGRIAPGSRYFFVLRANG